MALNEIHIDTPPERVFAVLADWRSYGDWVVGSRLMRGADPGRPAPGPRAAPPALPARLPRAGAAARARGPRGPRAEGARRRGGGAGGVGGGGGGGSGRK